MNTISIIADATGIIGFVLTIVLLIRSETLRNTIVVQRADYLEERKKIYAKLKSLRKNILEDNILDLEMVSEIRTMLYTFKERFDTLSSKEDKNRLGIAHSLLDCGVQKINKEALCKELDYFIARFERREVK